MGLLPIIPLISSVLLVVSGAYLLFRKKSSGYLRVLGVLLLLLSAAEYLQFLVFKAAFAFQAAGWQRRHLLLFLSMPFLWNFLSLIFARKEPFAELKRKGWYLVILILLGGWFVRQLLSGGLIREVTVFGGGYGFLLSGTGRGYFIFLLLSFIAALIQFEYAFKASDFGRFKTAIKGMALMLASYVAFSSLAVLFSYVDIRFTAAVSLAHIAGLIIIGRSGIKVEGAGHEITIGRQAVYTSATVTLAGAYLIIIAVIIKLFMRFGFNLASFLSFLAALGVFFILSMLIFSQSLRKRVQLFVDRSFYKDRYDYRREWSQISERLGTILDTSRLTDQIQKIIKEMMNVVGVEVVTRKEARAPLFDDEFCEWLLRAGEPVSIDELKEKRSDLYEREKEALSGLGARVIVSLHVKRERLGVLIVGKKRDGGGFSAEDRELLHTLSRQVAIALLNARLSEELIVSKQLEHFHKLSSFIIHDLKNCISMLSMIMQNAQGNFDKPDFQKDALSTISGTISRMSNLMRKLSSLPESLELERQETDINALIDEAFERTRIGQRNDINIAKEYSLSVPLAVDKKYFEKVMTNLLINAAEAMPEGGELTVRTALEEHPRRALVEVSDTGAGMSGEFITKRLFKPFQSSKKKGIGIGLYQCKTIIEAHGGTIEAVSKAGEGSRFLVRIPVQ